MVVSKIKSSEGFLPFMPKPARVVPFSSPGDWKDSTRPPSTTAQRPHTLNLPNHGQSRTGWLTAAGPPPQPQPLPPLLSHMTEPMQTTSVDSIGTCSLDVNATGTTSPATMEAVDGSRRSLRSVSLENNLCGSTSPNVTTPLRPILKPQPLTDPGSLKDPGGGTPDASGYKTPSYLGISCAVNGYSRLNRYDSSLRDGFRSRDASPARLAFSRSRDSSPMRPEWKLFDPRNKISPQQTAAKIRELKEELARFKAEFPPSQFERGRQNSTRKSGRRLPQTRSISVDRGYLTKAGSKEIMNGHQQSQSNSAGQRGVRLVEINMTDSNRVKSSRYEYSFEQSVVRDGVCESSESIHCSSRTNGEYIPDKSFIQSRIERLYGPSALGAGFRSRRSLLELEKEQRDKYSTSFGSPSSISDNHFEPEAKAPEGFPSVFRHLRPEFRTQLQVKRNNRLKADLSLDVDISSPKTPGRVIPITLTDTIEKQPVAVEKPLSPPILHPKPQNLVNNKVKVDNSVQDKKRQQIVVKKIVNGNGNIKESMEVPILKEPYVNGDSKEEEKENNEKSLPSEFQKDRTSSCKVNGISENVKVNGEINGGRIDGEVKAVNNHVSESTTPSSPSKLVKEGNYFLKVVDDVVSKIDKEVTEIESYFEIDKDTMTEEVRGKVLAYIGKARLLVSQKIRQFQGLCHKNIASTAEEEFPTTNEDLAGFWDMVYIQVEHIEQMQKEVMTLKNNSWKEVVAQTQKSVTTGRAQKKPAPRPIRAAKSTKSSSEKSEEDKAREEARKKMMAERRKAMKEAMKAKKAEAAGEDSVEIFAPGSK